MAEQKTTASASVESPGAGPKPYPSPGPAPSENPPTVAELHSRLPEDAPGVAESKEQREAREKREEEAALHPPAFPGMHREFPGGPLISDDKNDPGINANIIS